jgi:hypothetical protein
VNLIWTEEVATLDEALLHEHQIKGWSRVKNEALVRGEFQAIHEIVKEERKRREKSKKEQRWLSARPGCAGRAGRDSDRREET